MHSVRGPLVEVSLPGASIGEGVRLRGVACSGTAEVVSVARGRVIIAPHFGTHGLRVGDLVQQDPSALRMSLGTSALGRCFAATGIALDGGAGVRGCTRAVHTQPPLPSERDAIRAPLWTGIRVIDGLLTIGRGARVGLFGAPGAGKSTLLHRMMSGTTADVFVIGLIGERGREAEEWIARAQPHSTIVCATSDRPAAERVRAANVALAQACALRDRGLHVVLVIDSLARFASALREVALASGEPPGRGGYPGSIFARLASFVEGAGAFRTGSITMIATVLSDGDERDAVSDAARSLLDGHIELSIALAHAGHFPAINVLASASRTMRQVLDSAHAANAVKVRNALAVLAGTADARSVGIIPTDPVVAEITSCEEAINRFIRQGNQAERPAETRAMLTALAAMLPAP